MKARLFLSSAALILSLPSAAAKGLSVDHSTASSTFPDEEKVSYDAGRVSDSKLSTAWVEGEQGSGLGEWVQLDLGGTKEVHRVKVWGGMWYSRTYWDRSNRPKEIELAFSDGSTKTMTLDDEMRAQEIVLGSPKRTDSLRLKIKSVYPGSTWLDTPISEVQVFDAEPAEGAPVRAVTSSTQMADDGDGSYDPMNVADGLGDSMWCEGTDEDGTGEWLEFQFSGNQRIGKLRLINGTGSGLPLWMKNNRASAATLEFSDGSTAEVAIKNTMLPQQITFDSRTTSSVKVTFTSVVKGKQYNDLCISEAQFE
jgi:hypothetical protein